MQGLPLLLGNRLSMFRADYNDGKSFSRSHMVTHQFESETVEHLLDTRSERSPKWTQPRQQRAKTSESVSNALVKTNFWAAFLSWTSTGCEKQRDEWSGHRRNSRNPCQFSLDAPAFDRQYGIDEIHRCCPSQPVFALFKVALQLHLEANRQRCTQLLSLSGCSYSLG